MNTLYQNRKSVIAIVVLLLAFFFGSMLFAPDSSAPVAEVADPGEDLLSVAQELSNINFDQGLFQKPGYRSLVDWSAPIPAQPTGRTNPFEIIGRD